MVAKDYSWKVPWLSSMRVMGFAGRLCSKARRPTEIIRMWSTSEFSQYQPCHEQRSCKHRSKHSPAVTETRCLWLWLGAYDLFLLLFLLYTDSLGLSQIVFYSKWRMNMCTIQANLTVPPCTAFAKNTDCVLQLWKDSALRKRSLLLTAALGSSLLSSHQPHQPHVVVSGLFSRMDFQKHSVY